MAVIEIRPGDTIDTPPGEWHWHGAAPDLFMTHRCPPARSNDRGRHGLGDPDTDSATGVKAPQRLVVT
jgi:quercetin dioxygenase-like cupin family protein